MFAALDKDELADQNNKEQYIPLYKAGETIKGTLFFELKQASSQHEIYMRLQGCITMPENEIQSMKSSSEDSVERDNQSIAPNSIR